MYKWPLVWIKINRIKSENTNKIWLHKNNKLSKTSKDWFKKLLSSFLNKNVCNTNNTTTLSFQKCQSVKEGHSKRHRVTSFMNGPKEVSIIHLVGLVFVDGFGEVHVHLDVTLDA